MNNLIDLNKLKLKDKYINHKIISIDENNIDLLGIAKNLTNLEDLRVDTNCNLEEFSNLPNLKQLTVFNPNQSTLNSIANLNNITNLDIYFTNEIEDFYLDFENFYQKNNITLLNISPNFDQLLNREDRKKIELVNLEKIFSNKIKSLFIDYQFIKGLDLNIVLPNLTLLEIENYHAKDIVLNKKLELLFLNNRELVNYETIELDFEVLSQSFNLKNLIIDINLLNKTKNCNYLNNFNKIKNLELSDQLNLFNEKNNYDYSFLQNLKFLNIIKFPELPKNELLKINQYLNRENINQLHFDSYIPDNFYKPEEYKSLKKINIKNPEADETFFNTDALSPIILNNIELNQKDFYFNFKYEHLKLSKNYEEDYPIILQLQNFNEKEINLSIKFYHDDYRFTVVSNLNYLKNFPFLKKFTIFDINYDYGDGIKVDLEPLSHLKNLEIIEIEDIENLSNSHLLLNLPFLKELNLKEYDLSKQNKPTSIKKIKTNGNLEKIFDNHELFPMLEELIIDFENNYDGVGIDDDIFYSNKFPNLKKIICGEGEWFENYENRDPWGDYQMYGITEVKKLEEITYLNLNMYSLKEMVHLKKVDNLSVTFFNESDVKIINNLDIKNLSILNEIADYKFFNLDFFGKFNTNLKGFEFIGSSVNTAANLNQLAYLKNLQYISIRGVYFDGMENHVIEIKELGKLDHLDELKFINNTNNYYDEEKDIYYEDDEMEKFLINYELNGFPKLSKLHFSHIKFENLTIFENIPTLIELKLFKSDFSLFINSESNLCNTLQRLTIETASKIDLYEINKFKNLKSLEINNYDEKLDLKILKNNLSLRTITCRNCKNAINKEAIEEKTVIFYPDLINN